MRMTPTRRTVQRSRRWIATLFLLMVAIRTLQPVARLESGIEVSPHQRSGVLIIDNSVAVTHPGLILDTSPSLNLISKGHVTVPRGQSYFYTSPESLRLASYETWRPEEYVGYRRPIAMGPVPDNILLLIQTSAESLWKHLPIQLITLLRQFPEFQIYSDFADSVGGEEVKDALRNVDTHIVDESPEFEPYRILKTIREHHVSISADDVQIPGITQLKRFVLLPMLYNAYKEHPNFDWYIVTDDRVSLFDQNVRSFLKKYNSNNKLFIGKHYQHDSGNACCLILSKAAMKAAFYMSKEEAEVLIFRKYTDMARKESDSGAVLSSFLEHRAGIKLDKETSHNYFQNEPIYNVKLSADNWCKPILSLGNQRPRDIENVADYSEFKRGMPILHSDVYLDYIKPYLKEGPQRNWDNRGQDLEYSPSLTPESRAYESLDACKSECYRNDQCLMYRYDAYTKYCGLGISSVSLGGPVLKYATSLDSKECEKYGIRCAPREKNDILTSEWLITRIILMRRSLECDVLHLDPQREGVIFGALDQVEGWWHRAKQSA